MKKVTAFQSKDGLLFLTEDECLDHEYLVNIKETEAGKEWNPNSIEGADLTPAETKVYDRLFTYDGLQDIADDLDVSLSCIKAHCKKIYRKTGTKNKMDLYKKVSNLV